MTKRVIFRKKKFILMKNYLIFYLTFPLNQGMTAVVEQYIHEQEIISPEMFPILRKELIFEDDEPMESDDHRDFMTNLIQLVRSAWGLPVNYFVAGNVAVYFSTLQIKNKSFKAPDFILVKNVDGTKHREGWVVWEENNKYPDLIIELLSPSTFQDDLITKKELYEKVLQTPEYFVCNPKNPSELQGWHLENGVYMSIVPNQKGWLWSNVLGYYIGYWEGAISNKWRNWLRFYDTDENLVLLFDEKEKFKAKQAEDKAKQAEDKAKQAEDKAKQAEDKVTNGIKNMLQSGKFSKTEIAHIFGISEEAVESVSSRL
jgi:Uma2 family endonuclease